MENPRQVTLVAMKKLDKKSQSIESSSSMTDSEPSSCSSSLSAELGDDATSYSSSTSSSSSSRGALFEFADLMAQLPIKRGLSKYYGGKSESFGSLASVKSVEDLAKKEIRCYNKRMKGCKSYGSNLNRHKFSPKPTIAKRSSSPKGSALTCIFTI